MSELADANGESEHEQDLAPCEAVIQNAKYDETITSQAWAL